MATVPFMSSSSILSVFSVGRNPVGFFSIDDPGARKKAFIGGSENRSLTWHGDNSSAPAANHVGPHGARSSIRHSLFSKP